MDVNGIFFNKKKQRMRRLPRRTNVYKDSMNDKLLLSNTNTYIQYIRSVKRNNNVKAISRLIRKTEALFVFEDCFTVSLRNGIYFPWSIKLQTNKLVIASMSSPPWREVCSTDQFSRSGLFKEEKKVPKSELLKLLEYGNCMSLPNCLFETTSTKNKC